MIFYLHVMKRKICQDHQPEIEQVYKEIQILSTEYLQSFFSSEYGKLFSLRLGHVNPDSTWITLSLMFSCVKKCY